MNWQVAGAANRQLKPCDPRNARIFVELPPQVVISQSPILGAGSFAFQNPCSAAAQIVMDRVRQSDRFVFDQIPTCVNSAHVVAYVTCQKPMLASLDLLFEPLAIVGKGRLLIGMRPVAKKKR